MDLGGALWSSYLSGETYVGYVTMWQEGRGEGVREGKEGSKEHVVKKAATVGNEGASIDNTPLSYPTSEQSIAG